MSEPTKTAPEGAKQANAPAPPQPAPPAAPQFPPAPEGMVNVLINGRHAVVKAGANLVDAAKAVGVDIPVFCYHSRLSIAGQCRICLVETGDAPGRLVPGCHARVREGLQVFTETPLVKENQRAVMEFHLVNHPVDCAICDQAGECKLQDYYQAYDYRPARIATFKLNKPKRKTFGPLVVYDGERCILCTRCVRFMNEIAKEPQLAMVGRGDHSEIDTMPGAQLDSNYALNTVDVCPVGALLSRDFRFTSRVWYLDGVRSVCPGCANGCNMSAEVRGGVAYRLLPKKNEEVNQVWMCDEGRLTYHRTNDERVRHPRLGRTTALGTTALGTSAEADGIPAAEQAAAKAHAALAPHAGTAALAVAVSTQPTTEELFAALAYARDVLRVKKVYSTGRAPGAADEFLVRADRNPNANGLALVAKALGLELDHYAALRQAIDAGVVKHVAHFGGDVAEPEKAAASLGKLETLVMLASNESAVTAAATVLLPQATHLEQDGTFVNWYGRLQPFRQAFAPRFDARPGWDWAGLMSRAAGAAWTFASAAEAFALLAVKAPELAGLTHEKLPETGAVLKGFAPDRWPARAPRPAGM